MSDTRVQIGDIWQYSNDYPYLITRVVYDIATGKENYDLLNLVTGGVLDDYHPFGVQRMEQSNSWTKVG
jgi:hypothetical protein